MTSRTEAPGALVIPPGPIAPGRARGVPPLRREGPAKLTGAAKYADDLVFPGAWYGATIRSTDAHARFVALEPDPAFDWSKVVVVTAADIPGENIVSSIKADQPVLVPIGGEIQHHAEPLALLAAAGPRDPARGAPGRSGRGPSRCPPSSTRWSRTTSSPSTTIERGDVEAALGAADLVLEGEYRVGHQEQLYIENNAMIAVPREDGGVAITGSLQCPYYVHKALKRGLALDDRQAQVIQAETGGGFGGKEEYPSVIALHAALLALQGPAAGPDDLRPPRGHRGDDEAPPGDRPPPDRRDQRRPARRPGHRGRHGRRRVLHAHAGRPVPRRHPRRRPVPLPERPDPGPRDAHEHAAQRRVPRLRGAADRVRGRDPAQPDRRARSASRRSRSAGGTSTASATRRRPARSCARAWPARRSSSGPPRPPSSSGPRADRARRAADATGSGTIPGSRAADGAHAHRERHRPRPRLARRRLHRLGRGQARLGRLARADRRRPDPRPDRRPPRWARAPRRSSRSSSPRSSACRTTRSRWRPRTRPSSPTAARPSRRARRWSSAAWSSRPPRRLRETVESATGRPFAEVYRDDAPRARRRPASTSSSSRIPGISFDDETYRGDAYPAFGWAACVARVDVDLDTGEVHVRDVVAADDIGKVIHPVLAEGQVEGGTLQAVGYATIEEIKLRDGRYLNDRLATYIIPTALDAPRITTILVEAPFSGAPHGAKGVGELPMDVGAPAVVAAIDDATGVWITDLPASPERILAALAGRPDVAAAAARRLGAGPRMTTYRFTVNGAPPRSTCPACAACSTSCARTSP